MKMNPYPIFYLGTLVNMFLHDVSSVCSMFVYRIILQKAALGVITGSLLLFVSSYIQKTMT